MFVFSMVINSDVPLVDRGTALPRFGANATFFSISPRCTLATAYRTANIILQSLATSISSFLYDIEPECYTRFNSACVRENTFNLETTRWIKFVTVFRLHRLISFRYMSPTVAYKIAHIKIKVVYMYWSNCPNMEAKRDVEDHWK